MQVKVFVTGGTIDGLEYSSAEQEPADIKTLIPELLKSASVTVTHSIDVLMNKDSKFLTDEDRETILKNCQACKEKNIVVTHGTVTMAETAEFLNSKNLVKTIVLTGAMIPANQEGSDALFNLGGAFVAAESMPAGVYIVMNGQTFDADNVRKNIEKGVFEKITP